MKRVVMFLMAALILAAGAVTVFGQAQTEKLASGTYTVYAVAPQSWRFTFDPKSMANGMVSGHFAITDGTPKNIEVFVFDETNFFKWRGEDDAARATAKPLWSSGKKAEGDVSFKVTDAGNYYIVFSNMFAYEGTKALTADVKFQYDKK